MCRTGGRRCPCTFSTDPITQTARKRVSRWRKRLDAAIAAGDVPAQKRARAAIKEAENARKESSEGRSVPPVKLGRPRKADLAAAAASEPKASSSASPAADHARGVG
ncbi:MAG TPA: hypothetical protein VHC18_06675 [Amycolatopsis sp.]|nr:hypothetical protein [Amycolatopsis sp.]